MSEKAQPNGFSWEYHGGKRIALSNGPTDALVATGDSESSWLDISDENAQIVQDAFNRRATPTPDVAGMVEEARAKADVAQAMIKALCRPRGSAGSREWVMSIPARPDYDPDLVIGAAVRVVRQLADAIESLSRERAEARTARDRFSQDVISGLLTSEPAKVLVEGFKAAIRELNDVVDPFVLGSLKDHEPDIHTGGRWAETPQRILAIRKALALIEGEKKEG